MILIINKKNRNSLKIKKLRIFLKVESERIELSSKQVTKRLSTRLVFS